MHGIVHVGESRGKRHLFPQQAILLKPMDAQRRRKQAIWASKGLTPNGDQKQQLYIVLFPH